MMRNPTVDGVVLPVFQEARKAIANLASCGGSISKQYESYKSWAKSFEEKVEGLLNMGLTLGPFEKEWGELDEEHQKLCALLRNLAGSPKQSTWNRIEDTNAWETYKVGITFSDRIGLINFVEHDHGEDPKEFPCAVTSVLSGDEFKSWWEHVFISASEARELFKEDL
jgi:hypothetical protein